VLGGSAAVEAAAKKAGHDVTVPFTPGRTDATQEQTDVESFAVLEPKADGFRNYLGPGSSPGRELLVDRAQLLTLTAPEMTVLVGGLRVLGANTGGASRTACSRRIRHADERLLRQPARHGHRVEGLAGRCEHFYEGRDRKHRQDEVDRHAVDLVFGSNSQLRAIAEVYASDDAKRSSSPTSSPPGPR
jgi:catalase-peroxidase